jgi:hypothetical protein
MRSLVCRNFTISAEEKLHSENPFLRRNENEGMNWRFIPFSRCA